MKVRLTVVARELDWATRLAGPYVLLHELVSHAFVGPWDDKVRAGRPADVRFAEGWMDTVAFQVHNDVMDGAPGLGGFGASFAHGNGCLVSARGLHDARYVRVPGDGAYGARLFGRQAATRLLDTFKGLPETADAPLDAFWRLSAALNTSELPQLDRYSLLAKLHCRLSFDKRSQAPPVVALLREWYAGSRTGTGNRDAWDAALRFARAVINL